MPKPLSSERGLLFWHERYHRRYFSETRSSLEQKKASLGQCRIAIEVAISARTQTINELLRTMRDAIYILIQILAPPSSERDSRASRMMRLPNQWAELRWISKPAWNYTNASLRGSLYGLVDFRVTERRASDGTSSSGQDLAQPFSCEVISSSKGVTSR